MASMFRSGPSRRQADVSTKLRIQLTERTSKVHSDSDVEENDDDGEDDDENLPVMFGNGVSDDVAEGTTAHSEPIEDAHVRKKPPTRIDTSVLGNICCSACGRQVNPYKNGAVQKHAQLKVVICKHCSKFLSSGEISKDQDGADEQCRWCGEGGRLLVCDDCSSAFCKSCVMRNFSRSEFNNINSQDNWLCYLCNDKPLKSLQENYRKIRDTLKALQEKQKAKATASAASPASTSSQLSKKTVDTKQSSKSALFTSNSKIGAGANSVSSEAPASVTLLSSEDLNVGPENVDATIDKLTTATNTLRDVLQALRSQKAGSAYTELKRKQQARALNKSLETFLKSVKTILTESDVADDEGQVQNLPPAKSASSSLSPRSHSSSRSAATSVSLAKETNATHSSNKSSDSKKSVLVQQISSESNGDSANILDIAQVMPDDIPSSKNKDKTNSIVNMNGDATKKSSKERKDSEITPARNSSRSSRAKTTKCDNKDDSDSGEEESTSKKDTAENTEESHSKDKMLDNEAGQNHSRKGKHNSEKNAKETLEKETVSENGSEYEAQIDSDASIDSAEKEKTVSSTPDYENLAAKFDLIKEIADEISRDNRDHDQENGDNEGNDEEEDDDLPITFGGDSKSKKPESDTKTVKRKKGHASSSDEDRNKTEKKSKTSKSADAKKSVSEIDNKKGKQDKKQNQDSEVDDSSSDPLSSGDEDTAAKTKRKTRKATEKEKQKTTKNDAKTTSAKHPDAKTKKRSEKEEKPSDMDEIDKEIAKLAKLPTRKRKAADDDEEKVEEKEDTSNKVKQAPVKRAKPGPKSSKKGIDYDDLSSDGHEGKDDDDDEADEDEDELPVIFFGKTEEPAEQEGLDENEMAKKGLLEDNESENDDSEEAAGDSSSDEESDKESSKNTKKEKKKEPVGKAKNEDKTDSDKNNDSDENIGKRKKVHSKLLDAKLSDSDSDIGSKKKKKNDAEAESKSGKSSGSSSDSDLSDEDDSDDSDDDDSDTKSKKKGKKKGKKGKKGKGAKSEEEDESSEEDGKKNKKGKGKKRRRIKKMSNSSDEGGGSNEDDDDDPNSSKAGKRRQIRKLMSNKKLEDSTKAAAKAEEKRRKRIAAKQREFNIETITDENNPMNGQVTTKLVLEPGKEEGDEPIVEVSRKLVCKLKPHQVEGVQFLWDCLYESVKRAKKGDGAGCILAHCMGLGKTLSVISFVHTILTHEKVLKHRTCLIVSPLNTVLNWKNEWSMWFEEEDQLEVWELAGCKQNNLRAKTLREWQESGGIMIIGYEMYRNLTTGNRCKNKKQKAAFYETLVNPGPDLVICDEGHILKNEASAVSKAMNQIRTRRRVVLTGTPLQNNLTEYHCMLSFVKPNLLGTRKEFTNRFISPIQNGQCTDSTPRDFKLMKARAHVLHEMLAGCVQRRDYSALTKFLPPKQEYVISVRLTNIQIELYEKYLELTGQGVDGIYTNKGARLFRDYQNLMKIWTHPWVLKLAEIRDELKVKYDDEDSFIDDEDTDEEMSFSSSSSSSDDGGKAGSDSGEEGTSSKAKTKRGTRRTRAKARRDAGEDSDPEEVIAEWKTKSRKDGPSSDVEEMDKTLTRDWWAAYVTEDDQLKLELSNKLYLLFEILRMCEEIGDKVLIFSQSILSLNIIESFLEVIDAKFQQECENLPEEEREKQGLFGRSWTKNLDYYRMDGTTSAQSRHNWASSFNDLDNYRARLFLISTRAGGLGINLVAANRVIIFDASWNPSHDVQSIFRVYRFGQTKPCYIYRFLAQGTMEEKIYERQVTKLSLSQRVVDEHQIERHFSANDLKELYNFRPDRLDDGTEKPTLSLPKDPLLAEILTNNKHCVVSFHEHDSLLENQIEQTLTEEEKKAAWDEYENEKKGIIKGPGIDGRAAGWPMMAAAQLLSREQIAATVQALRQQLPDVSENLFQLHLQQALRRQVQIKQEEMKKLEMLRLQELNYLNMLKHQNQQSGMSRAQIMQNMSWLQQMRAAQQNAMFMGSGSGQMGMNQAASGMNWPGQTSSNIISNNPEEAIDLDDN